MLAWQSLSRLSTGIDQLVTARNTVWQRVAPLFNAAAPPRPAGNAGVPDRATAAQRRTGARGDRRRVSPRAPRGRRAQRLPGNPACGDRLLIQGASGSGESTLASLLTGMRLPRSGLVLARGLDMSCLGWRGRVPAAPQFHDNHVLSESFAFNLLMSRNWPPRDDDMALARAICHELGLGPLLRRMPGEMFQSSATRHYAQQPAAHRPRTAAGQRRGRARCRSPRSIPRTWRWRCAASGPARRASS